MPIKNSEPNASSNRIAGNRQTISECIRSEEYRTRNSVESKKGGNSIAKSADSMWEDLIPAGCIFTIKRVDRFPDTGENRGTTNLMVSITAACGIDSSATPGASSPGLDESPARLQHHQL